MEYISDRERGPRLRTLEEIPDNAWAGIVAHIEAALEQGDFAEAFPTNCDDPGKGVVATDRVAFFGALRAEVPGIYRRRADETPDVLTALDAIQFCHEHVCRATVGVFHTFYQHHHLEFDWQVGASEFRAKVNRIFERNGIAFTLTEKGQILRTIPEELEDVRKRDFDTGDRELDQLLDRATLLIVHPDLDRRTDALEKLWDGWERLKTIHGQDRNDKKPSITKLLDNASAGNSVLRQHLEDEATALTALGNQLRIRHHERGTPRIEEPEQIDYLFFRMLALIRLLSSTIEA